MKLTKLTIEGMHKVHKQMITFDQLNYVYGPNGVGKSTILQAIQLALLGYIPGQSKASKEAIFRHANGRIIAVTLELEDNGSPITVSRVWTQVGSTITSAVTVDPATVDVTKLLGSLELPVFNFNEFISMTANKLKDWFIDFLPSSKSELNLWSEMHSAVTKAGVKLTDRFDEFIAGYAHTSAGIDDLTKVNVDDVRKMNAALKSLMTAKKSELARAQGAIQSLIHYDDFEEIYSESEYQSKLKYAMDGLVAQKSYEAQKSKFDYYMSQIDSYTASLNELELYSTYEFAADPDSDPEIAANLQQLNFYVDQYRKYEEDVHIIESKLAGIVAEMNLHKSVVAGGSVCPFTHATCESIKASVDEAADKLAKLKVEYDALHSLKAKDNLDMSAIHTKQTELQNQIAKKKHAYDNRDQLKSQINFLTQQTSTIAPPAEDRSVAEWEQMIAELQDYHSKSEANRRYNELIDKLTADKFDIDSEIEAIKIWDKLTGVNGLQASVGEDNPFDTFASKLNKYIPILFGENCWADFNITSKANSFSFGINRGATYIPFDLLSSGEKCMYTLALMVCIAAESDSALKLVLVDDLFDHLDDNNVSALFTALSKIDTIQMVFAGVRPAEFGQSIDVESLSKS